MDLRRLRYFVAVAECGNISKAARKIFLTQPALSRQIKALEDEIGQLLIERKAHSIQLTPTGEALLREARGLLEHADQALERVRACGEGVRLRIGYAPSLASGLLTVAIGNFVQKHSNARVELLDLSSQEMLAGLEAGTLDLALTVAPERETRGLRWTSLAAISWQVAVPDSHPLAKVAKVTPAKLAREPLLVFCQRDYPEYWSRVTSWLRDEGESPSIAGEYDGVSSLLAAVESGLGVALVTAGSADLVPRRVRLKPMASAPKPLAIAVGYRENRETDKPFGVLIEELRHAAAKESL